MTHLDFVLLTAVTLDIPLAAQKCQTIAASTQRPLLAEAKMRRRCVAHGFASVQYGQHIVEIVARSRAISHLCSRDPSTAVDSPQIQPHCLSYRGYCTVCAQSRVCALRTFSLDTILLSAYLTIGTLLSGGGGGGGGVRRKCIRKLDHKINTQTKWIQTAIRLDRK